MIEEIKEELNSVLVMCRLLGYIVKIFDNNRYVCFLRKKERQIFFVAENNKILFRVHENGKIVEERTIDNDFKIVLEEIKKWM